MKVLTLHTLLQIGWKRECGIEHMLKMAQKKVHIDVKDS